MAKTIRMNDDGSFRPSVVAKIAAALKAASFGSDTYARIVPASVLTRDSAGRIESATENGVTVTYGRDAVGRILTETRSGKVTTYTRDSAGRVSGWSTV